MLKITDEEIDKLAYEYGNEHTCKDWATLSGPPNGFANGMKYMRDLINQGKVRNDTN